MTQLTARLYMDTICSHSWNARIAIDQLRQTYGDLIDFDYVIYPLPASGQGRVPSRAARFSLYSHWGESSEFGGEPMANSMHLENPITDSVLAGEAYLAARHQGLEVAHRYLERLQLGVMAQRQRISDPVVLHRLAEQVGLDADRLMADLEQVQTAGEMAAVMEAAKTKGIRSRPTLVLSNTEGREYWVLGPQPYSEFVKAIEMLQAGAAAPTFTKVGGRILGYNDLTKTAANQVPSGVNYSLAVSDGRPNAPKAESESALRVGHVTGGPLPPTLLGSLWRMGISLVTVYGRAGSAPLYLVGVRPNGLDAAETAEQQFALLTSTIESAGLAITPASDAERDWLLGMTQRATSPSIMQFLPGRPRGAAPLHDLPGDFALITIADPIPEHQVRAKAAQLAAAKERYESELTKPEYRPQALALVESIAWREAHHRRWVESPPVGMWRAFTYLLTEGDQKTADAGAQALREVYFDPSHVTPLYVRPFHQNLSEHMQEHLQTFTLCNEQLLHGADSWNTPLTGTELARYLPGLFGDE